MLFVNDIIDNINVDLSNIFSINELKLFLILYEDDQVVLATSPETLQSLMNDIEYCCNICGLKQLTQIKQKPWILRKGGIHTSIFTFMDKQPKLLIPLNIKA